MCGIAGVMALGRSEEWLRDTGRSMLNTIIHRGPDAEGIWVNPAADIVLGHRRLAIQDLSENGAQPMISHSGRYCVVFNGEIYNFKELAQELVKCGIKFRGHSDTEVLLAAIETWGMNSALDRFNGMFAFALWDQQERALTLCRDRVGEKPLYYGVIDKRLIFASELKAIEAKVDSSKLNINKTALTGYLKYGCIDAPYSIYDDIYKLPPGTFLTVKPDDLGAGTILKPLHYWNVLDAANRNLINPYASEQEAIEGIDQLLRSTIQRQLIADVRVGTFLSGGVDSTLVSAIAQDLSVDKVKTFTIGYHEKDYDESVFAEKIARHIGSDQETVRITAKDTLNVIPELPAIYDEPFADSSQIPTYLVSKIARQHLKVCLSGDGGDELFSGYNRYIWNDALWNRLDNIPLLLRKLMGGLLASPSPRTWDRAYNLLSSANDQDRYKLVGLKLQKLAGLLKQRTRLEGYDFLLSYWNKSDRILTDDYFSSFTSRPNKFPDTENFMEQAMYWDQMSYLPSDNLVKVDRASMRVSLETRLPLLSHEVLEHSWRVPMAYKVRNNINKWLLRRVLDKYVPRELIDRPKMGFSVPIAGWLRGELKQWAEDYLFADNLGFDGMFDRKTIRKIWQEHLSGRYDHSSRLWTLLMLFSWRSSRR